MPSWGTNQNLPSPPTTIVDGAIGKYGSLDITGVPGAFTHIAVQFEFSTVGAAVGTVEVRLSVDDQGQQNEPQTLTLLDSVPINGSTLNYKTGWLVLNGAYGGGIPPNAQCALVNNCGQTITHVAGVYRTLDMGG